MTDRIPPRTVTELPFTLSVALVAGQAIYFEVTGNERRQRHRRDPDLAGPQRHE